MDEIMAIGAIVGGIIAIVLLTQHWRRMDEAERERRDAKELRAKYGPEMSQAKQDELNHEKWQD
jgi:uncharacterized protein (DUF2062 family)